MSFGKISFCQHYEQINELEGKWLQEKFYKKNIFLSIKKNILTITKITMANSLKDKTKQ